MTLIKAEMPFTTAPSDGRRKRTFVRVKGVE